MPTRKKSTGSTRTTGRKSGAATDNRKSQSRGSGRKSNSSMTRSRQGSNRQSEEMEEE